MRQLLKQAILFLTRTDQGVSRLVLFVNGIAVGIGTLALVFAFIFDKDRSGYVEMVVGLGAGSIAAGAGHMMSVSRIGRREKKPDSDQTE